ncbi:tryptophan 2,3-dioxygenase family protein [Streptomyces sp. NPDC051109]|uniref:tryptophan 2,3-dioxygenase family protein n=1 Tax=Streptomyces sp. NPDC051109 TaxID=3365642 RepID=UPI0037984D5D
MKALTDWLAAPEPDRFPYAGVVAAYREGGKHFVPGSLLALLDRARGELTAAPAPVGAGQEAAREVLERFLDTALDKYDGRYDYPTYTALSLLAPPAGAGPEEMRGHRDRLVVHLLGDLARFELEAVAGETALLPQLRPSPLLVGKRHRLALRVAAPALARLGLLGPVPGEEPEKAARRLWETADASMTARERLVLDLSMLPVHVTHDEYLFIRVLQAFEATFTLLAAELRAAIEALDAGRGPAAADRLRRAAAALTESAPLFSLLATMQAEAFRVFREFTEGASAIQSRSYKLVESLCRTPDAERLHSHAYRSVPEVREQVLAGQRSLDDAYADALAGPRAGRGCVLPAAAAMEEFASAMRRWRQTHYRLAVRMLGSRSGTGYTEGTPYLGEVRKIPVFDSVHCAQEAEASSAA